jgi:hypothetical protein
MASIIGVETLQNPNGTTAATIATDGSITTTKTVTVTARPAFLVVGRADHASLTAANSTFDYITTWTSTRLNQGSLLNSGGYAEIPAGQAGLYNISFFIHGINSNDYTSAILYLYDASASAYVNLLNAYAFNDYSNYTTGGNLIYDLSVGDKLYAGFDDRYGVPSGESYRNTFSMYKI